MLLTTRGSKSGKRRSIPIGYFMIGGVIHLFSAWGKTTAWYKNMRAHPDDVWLQVGLRKFHVCAQPVEQPAEILNTLTRFVEESPGQAHSLLGWDADRDRIGAADFSVVIDRVFIVRFVEHPENT
jgi:deazaflavin-dependent oxidoreductase (nitroreductase family)